MSNSKTKILTEVSESGVITFTTIEETEKGETRVLAVQTYKSKEDFEKTKKQRIVELKENIEFSNKEIEYLESFKIEPTK